LQAVERLVASGHLLDAVIQLRAVRGSVDGLAVELYMTRVEGCLAKGFPAAAIDELLAMARLPIRRSALRSPVRRDPGVRLRARPTSPQPTKRTRTDGAISPLAGAFSPKSR
jgi:hypothetical protein